MSKSDTTPTRPAERKKVDKFVQELATTNGDKVDPEALAWLRQFTSVR